MKDRVIVEGEYKLDYKVCPHENKVYRQMTQPSADLILARNAELRKNPGVINDLSFGRYHLSIPLNDFEMLRRKHPELRSSDNSVRTAWYKKFIKSSDSLKYRVQ